MFETRIKKLLTLSITLFFSWMILLLFPFSLQESKTNLKTKVGTTLKKEGKQERDSVKKELWFAQENGSRLKAVIESKGSTLYLVPDGDKMDLVEELYQLRCLMQERLDPVTKTQQVRFFEAKQGSYCHSSQLLKATDALLAIFKLPGTALPAEKPLEKPLLEGVAQTVSFAASGKESSFEADHFQARVTGTTSTPRKEKP